MLIYDIMTLYGENLGKEDTLNYSYKQDGKVLICS